MIEKLLDISINKLIRVTVFVLLVTIQFFICNAQYKLYNNNMFLLENGTITTTDDYFMTGRDDDRFVGIGIMMRIVKKKFML